MVQTQTYALQAATRTAVGKQVKALRAQGIVPGVVYGHGKSNQTVQIEQAALEKAYQQVGSGSVLDLTVDQQTPVPVVIQELSHNHLTDDIEHVDFHAVRMDEVISAQIMLVFAGESAAVKTAGGTLVKNKDRINVKCLPSKMIKELTVNISSLATFEDTIKVKALVLPDGIQVLDQPEEIIALVKAPRTDEELAALNQTITEDVSKVEGVIKATPEDAVKPEADTKKTEAKKEAKK